MTSQEGKKEKQQGERESIIGVIIQALVCKRCSAIDCVVFIALAIIDLLKPYFSLICGCKCATNQPVVFKNRVIITQSV